MIAILPSAVYSTATPGLASVCAWHSEIEPGSTEAANEWTHAQGLKASHGVCPCCRDRVLAANLAEVRKLRAGTTNIRE